MRALASEAPDFAQDGSWRRIARSSRIVHFVQTVTVTVEQELFQIEWIAAPAFILIENDFGASGVEIRDRARVDFVDRTVIGFDRPPFRLFARACLSVSPKLAAGAKLDKTSAILRFGTNSLPLTCERTA